MVNIIKLNELPGGDSQLTDDDIILIMDDPSGNKVTKTLSLSALKNFIGSSGGTVSSVNAKTGDVILNKDDIGLNNVDNTSDLNKPISNATQNALSAKAPINNASFTGIVSGITKGMVGLGSVDNTSDVNKPISNATQNALNNKSNINHTHNIEDINNLQGTLDSKQPSGSYATLVNGKVPAVQLPSYVDEVLEYANFETFPNPGSLNIIYVDLLTNKIYRWSGNTYIEIGIAPGTTDTVLEGVTNLYFTNSRASAAAPVQSVAGKTGSVILTKNDVGLSNVDNTSDANKPVSNAQASAISNAQAYSIQRSNHTGTQLANTISDFNSAVNAAAPVQSVSGKTGIVTLNKNDIGLNNVDNTSDLNKPISNATQTALNSKENTITAGTTGQYLRGDKTWQTLDKSVVGLSNVDNTNDTNKPISNATQIALNNKENVVSAGIASQYYRGDKVWATLDKSSVGLSNVDNTSDANKPISTATQNALNLKANISDITTNGIFSCGRLTISQGNPVVIFTATNPSATGSTIYYTPYNGNLISLYDIANSKWKVYSFNELNLNISSLSANTNFDIFLYDNSGTLTLQAVAWSDNTTRATSLLLQNGIYVNSTAINKRYLGTIRTTTTGICEDAIYRNFIWNNNNKIFRRINNYVTTTHTYASTIIRPFNNNTTVGYPGGRMELVIGLQESVFFLSLRARLTNGTVGIGLDSTNTGAYDIVISSPDSFEGGSTAHAYTTAGYHYLQLLEWTDGTTGTFYTHNTQLNILS